MNIHCLLLMTIHLYPQLKTYSSYESAFDRCCLHWRKTCLTKETLLHFIILISQRDEQNIKDDCKLYLQIISTDLKWPNFYLTLSNKRRQYNLPQEKQIKANFDILLFSAFHL